MIIVYLLPQSLRGEDQDHHPHVKIKSTLIVYLINTNHNFLVHIIC